MLRSRFSENFDFATSVAISATSSLSLSATVLLKLVATTLQASLHSLLSMAYCATCGSTVRSNARRPAPWFGASPYSRFAQICPKQNPTLTASLPGPLLHLNQRIHQPGSGRDRNAAVIHRLHQFRRSVLHHVFCLAVGVLIAEARFFSRDLICAFA